jgi:cell filamentation protein
MKNSERYKTSRSDEGEYQPGSEDTVLKNFLGLTIKEEVEHVETEKLIELSRKAILSVLQDKRFCEKDIISMHKQWLSEIYSWAGQYRQVNMSKGGFPFAAAHLIPSLMKEFDRVILSAYTPCTFNTEDEILTALAVVHVEFVLIHPFREGNGRLARLLSQLMALQAQLPLIDFSRISHEKKKEYFSAIREGLNRNYEPMKIIFAQLISTSQ